MKKTISLLILCIYLVSCNDNLDTTKDTGKDSPTIKVQVTPINDESPNGRTNANIINPNSGIFKDGDQVSIQWDLCVCFDWASQYVNIYLYKGNTNLRTIAYDVPFLAAGNVAHIYEWTIPYLNGYWGNDMNIRIADTQNPSNTTMSDYFTINFSNRGTSFLNPIDIGTAPFTNNGYIDQKMGFNNDYLNNYGFSGDDVYYKFTLASAGTAYIDNCNQIRDYSIYLFDHNYNLIETGSSGVCDYGSAITRALSPGTYYVISEGLSDEQAAQFDPVYSYILPTSIGIH